MASVTLELAQKSEIKDAVTHIGLEDRLQPGYYTAISSDTTVASIADSGRNTLAVFSVGAGTATITVTRMTDGATITGTATVNAAGALAIEFGAPEPA